MELSSLLLLLQFLCSSHAQQVGTEKPEKAVPFTVQQCDNGACKPVQGGLTIDANWRWTHKAGQDCYQGTKWDPTICANGDDCAKNCAIEGADYEKDYGVVPTGTDSVTLKFVTNKNVGSRMYLLDASGQKYQMFMLKNKQFSFDVDVSKLPCGINGALYFTAMDADGGTSAFPNNKAGAKYGTGYCDAQCPRDIKFIAGKANSEGWQGEGTDAGKGKMGNCCPEMDIWEANSISQAFTPHTCKDISAKPCTGALCGDGEGNRYKGLCDKDGCDFASYRWGATEFYGKGKKVDTSKKMTVTTQFVTKDNTDRGELSEIRRVYVQDGKVIQNEAVKIKGMAKPTADSLTEEFCTANKQMTGDENHFGKNGGLKRLGDSMAKGMVLVMSIWDDGEAKMQWLDGTYPPGKSADTFGAKRGTCEANTGDPTTVRAANPDASVTFSNVKIGPIVKVAADAAGGTAPKN
ncbi:hypothetical protein Pst134EA_029011 [Puccinia striiformis f. sp. tritici]|nr:hypothetical protein Pst134EA_029011 [Puccinia striiformis f. sp. tritici]KAH9447026.1 hypothetical protein Pst134EA_029011 [Puccinia striiformis f. sp. tritici]KAI9630153.1 hypothetical protein KEM48_012183 [Puccinia striiformis f. sp. tritici PST-130]